MIFRVRVMLFIQLSIKSKKAVADPGEGPRPPPYFWKKEDKLAGQVK